MQNTEAKGKGRKKNKTGNFQKHIEKTVTLEKNYEDDRTDIFDFTSSSHDDSQIISSESDLFPVLKENDSVIGNNVKIGKPQIENDNKRIKSKQADILEIEKPKSEMINTAKEIHKINSGSASKSGNKQMDEADEVFTFGSVVWAKLNGYPWWPAMIDDDPNIAEFILHDKFKNIPTHYHVVFFDKNVSRSWIKTSCLQPFTESSAETVQNLMAKSKKYSARIKSAKVKAKRALTMNINQRIEEFGFLKRFKGSGADYESNNEEDLSALEDRRRRKKKAATKTKEPRSPAVPLESKNSKQKLNNGKKPHLTGEKLRRETTVKKSADRSSPISKRPLKRSEMSTKDHGQDGGIVEESSIMQSRRKMRKHLKKNREETEKKILPDFKKTCTENDEFLSSVSEE